MLPSSQCMDCAGVLIDYVYIRQRQKGSAACTVVLEREEPNSLRCELEVTSVEQVSACAKQPLSLTLHCWKVGNDRTARLSKGHHHSYTQTVQM